eukprot:202877-Rhodomonas_salina.1
MSTQKGVRGPRRRVPSQVGGGTWTGWKHSSLLRETRAVDMNMSPMVPICGARADAWTGR